MTFTPGTKKQQICVYDPAGASNPLNDMIKKQISKLFGKKKEDLKIARVFEDLKIARVEMQRQRDGVSCGYFAVVIVAALIEGHGPENLQIDDNPLSLKIFLTSIFENGVIPPLTTRKRKREVTQEVISAAVFNDVLANPALH